MNVSPDQLNTTIYVLLALFGTIVTVDKVIDIVKKWRSPSTETERKLATDKRRLDEHEEAIKDLQKSSQVLCTGVLALLDHELHNGNTEQIEKARDGIMNYLSGMMTH